MVLSFSGRHTMGRMQSLARVMPKEEAVTGLKSSILGYISIGDRVPVERGRLERI